MQMLFGNMNVCGTDAAFQVFPKVFQAIDMRTVQDIFLLIVVNYFVVVALLSQAVIGDKLIRVRRGTFLDVLLNDWMEGFDFAIRHNFGHYLTTALEHSKDNGFIFRAASATHAMRFSANVGFVNFNIAGQGQFAIHFCHVLSDFMAHAPSRLVSHAKLALQFFRRYAMAGCSEFVNRQKPELQRRTAILEQSADSGMKMMSANPATKGAFGLQAIPFGFLAAFRAGIALTKAAIKDVLQARVIIGELGEKFPQCHAVFITVIFHALNIPQTRPLCQGDNSVHRYSSGKVGIVLVILRFVATFMHG
jgi:hypothetical protein